MDNETKVLLKIVVALLSVQVKRGVSQSTLIRELGDAGLQPKLIAEITGTTSNTVRVTLHKHKKSSKR